MAGDQTPLPLRPHSCSHGGTTYATQFVLDKYGLTPSTFGLYILRVLEHTNAAYFN